jgi:hypothetical protein
VIKLVAKSANCYIVAPGTAENPTTSGPIPISRAIKYGGMPADAEVELEILWDDNSVISATPTLTGSSFRVTTTGNHGNAGIGIKDKATGDIYWSWHIWVTDYDPDNGGATWTNPNNTQFTFMDRNLGASVNTFAAVKATGLLYQWGRKDPFPGTETGTAGQNQLYKFKGMTDAGDPQGLVFNTTNQGQYIEMAIRFPTTFAWGWPPIHNHNLWTTTKNKKTIYDPCPAGWRVPYFLDGSPSTATDDNWPYKGVTFIYVNDGTYNNRDDYGNTYTHCYTRGYGNGAPIPANDMGMWWFASSFHLPNNGWLMPWHMKLGVPQQIYPRIHEFRAGQGQHVRCVKDN